MEEGEYARVAIARSRFTLFTVTSIASAGIALAALPLTPANAAPRPTLAQAQQQVHDLDVKAGAATEVYNEARIALDNAKKKSAGAQAEVDRQRARVAKVQQSLSALAASAYRSGGTDAIVALVNTNDPKAFIDQATSLDQIARGQASSLLTMRTERKRLASAEQSLKDQVNASAALERQASSAKATIDSTLAAQQRILSSLRAEDRARLAALQAAENARASRFRPAAAFSYNGPASGRAGAALQEAYRQMGKPYVYGAAGPDSYDCSGLTMWAFGHAGISLPHSAAAQYNYGVHIPPSALQPGDLVFFSEGGYIGHVGIYVGGGNMIDAPHSGSYVGVRALYPGLIGGTRI